MNKNIFSNKSSKKSSKVVISETNTINKAGGVAYKLEDKAALAQICMTGCFNSTYYVSGEDQLKTVLELANKVDPEFVAKLAVYARQKGLMKDAPAVLAAVLSAKDTELLTKVFSKVVNDPKMFRNFIKVVRSGVTGRKSFGSRPKRLLQNYLDKLSDEQLFKADVGNDPSLQDCLKMIRPKPSNKARNALYGYLLDKEYSQNDLLALARDYEAFKKDMSKPIPDVPFQMLTALPLTSAHWKKIAENATWNQTRMNLNTFARHGVFDDEKLTNSICKKLQDPELVKKAKVFPYQLFTAYQNMDNNVPMKVLVALQKAADLSLENISEFNGKIFVLVDTSGSMKSPATGNRGSVTTKTTCVDVAALIASAIMRKNINAEIIPFDVKVHQHRLNPLDSVVTNAAALAHFGGGGTDCAAALKYLNQKKAKGDMIIMISDNESWFNVQRHGRGTGMVNEWSTFKANNPSAKLVCLDITPNVTTQVNTQKDVLNLGGFNDTCFDVISKFMESGSSGDFWIQTIESTQF